MNRPISLTSLCPHTSEACTQGSAGGGIGVAVAATLGLAVGVSVGEGGPTDVGGGMGDGAGVAATVDVGDGVGVETGVAVTVGVGDGVGVGTRVTVTVRVGVEASVGLVLMGDAEVGWGAGVGVCEPASGDETGTDVEVSSCLMPALGCGSSSHADIRTADRKHNDASCHVAETIRRENRPPSSPWGRPISTHTRGRLRC